MGKTFTFNKLNMVITGVFITILFTYGMSNDFFYLNWLIGFLLIIIMTLTVLKQGNINKIIIKCWFLMSLWLVPTILFTPLILDQNTHIIYILRTIFYITLSVIIVHILAKDKQRFLNVFYFASITWLILNSFALILHFFESGSFPAGNFSGIVHNRNTLSFITSYLMSVPIIFFNLYSIKQKRKLIIMILLSLLLILTTLSLKGTFGFILILGLAFLRNYKKKGKYAILTILFLGLIIILTNESALAERIDRFVLSLKSPEELRLSESAFERQWLIQESLNIVKENPLTGIGVNNSIHYLVTPYSQLKQSRGEKVQGTYSHNNYTEMLLNGGIPSFVLYYMPLIISLFYFPRYSRINEFAKYSLIMLIYMFFMQTALVSYSDLVMILIYASIIYTFYNIKYNTSIWFNKELNSIYN